MTKKAKKSIILTSLMVVAVAIFATLQIIKTIPAVADWWSDNIARHLVGAMSRVTDILPFSVFEFFIIFAVIIGIFSLVSFIALLARRKFHTALNGVIVMLLAVFCVANAYSATAEFQYHRSPLTLHQTKHEITLDKAVDMYEYYVKDFNALGARLPRDSQGQVELYSRAELNAALAKEYALLSDDYIYRYTPQAKSILNSWFMTDARITGITFMPTGEANYNRNTPPSTIPHTVAHEIAHAKGVMREDDANMLAYYILINSGDDYLRYCGYYQGMAMAHGVVRDAASATGKPLDEIALTPTNDFINKELEVEFAYWANSKSVIGKISGFFNDIYLKLNGSQNGTGSYWDDSTIDKDIQEDGSEIITVNYSDTALMLFDLYVRATAI